MASKKIRLGPKMKRYIGAFAAVLLAASALAGQSLAEIAKKERERRAKLEGPSSKVITESDIRTSQSSISPARSSSSSGSAGEEPASGEATAEEEAESTETQDPRQTEAYWRDRLKSIDDRIRKMEADLASPLYTSNLSGGPARQRLERDLQQARRDRQSLVEEARRAGVPPGWLR